MDVRIATARYPAESPSRPTENAMCAVSRMLRARRDRPRRAACPASPRRPLVPSSRCRSPWCPWWSSSFPTLRVVRCGRTRNGGYPYGSGRKRGDGRRLARFCMARSVPSVSPEPASGGSPRSRRPSMNTSRWRCATPASNRGSNPCAIGRENLASDQPDVGEIDTGSKRTLLLGRGDQFALRGGGRVQQRFHLGRVSYLVIEQRHDGRGADIQRTMHVSPKRGEGVRLLSGRGGGLRVRACHHIDSDCRHESSALGEVAIQRRDAHAGATGDGLERYIRTDFDEQRTAASRRRRRLLCASARMHGLYVGHLGANSPSRLLGAGSRKVRPWAPRSRIEAASPLPRCSPVSATGEGSVDDRTARGHST